MTVWKCKKIKTISVFILLNMAFQSFFFNVLNSVVCIYVIEIRCLINVKNAETMWLNIPWLRRFSSAQMVCILWCIKAGEKATLWLNDTIVSIIPFSTDWLKSAAYLELLSWQLCLDKRAHTILKKRPDLQQARKPRRAEREAGGASPGLLWAWPDSGSPAPQRRAALRA